MPIDPSIPLQVQPVQVPSALEAFGKFQALQNGMQRQQLNAEQLKSAQLANQLHEQTLDQQKFLMETYANTGGDPVKTKQAVMGKIPVKMIQEFEKSVLDHQKDLAGYHETELKIAKAATEALGSASQALLAAPAEQRPVLWPSVRQQLIQGKSASEQDLPAEYPGDQYLQLHGGLAIAADKQLDLEFKRREEARAITTAKEATESHLATLPGKEAASQLSQMTTAGQAPIQPAQAQEIVDRRLTREQAAAEADKNRAVTVRGQNMTDARGRELADLGRQAAADARENKPPSSAQTTVATYAGRLHEANPLFDRINPGWWERMYNKAVPNVMGTDNSQAFDQAERNFINAVLRRESGAVISPSEFTEARKQYIPQPGDGKQALELKRRNRQFVTESFRKAAGKAYEDPDTLIRQSEGGSAPAPKAPKAGIVEDGYFFMGGDPAKPENWKKVR